MADNGDAPNWDHFLQNSSALGILRPDAVFDVFGNSSSSSSSQTPVDAGVRVVRAGRVDGRSTFVADDLFPWYMNADGIAQIVADHQAVAGRSGQSGQRSSSSSSATSVFAISDTAPGAAVPARRPHALSYAVVLSGEIVLRLENSSGSGGNDEEQTTIRAGELAVVQPGTRHTWENHGIQSCRIAWMMVGGSGQRIELPDGSILG